VNSTADLYLAVREREGRLYSDEVVRELPDVPAGHPHRVEWMARRASARRLIFYFQRQRRPLRILDLGCGNGWLSAALAGIPGVSVYGVDTNGVELRQAGRVFGGPQPAMFLGADIFHPPFSSGVFDSVVIASAVQYFADLRGLIAAIQPLLGPRGEMHIIDSPFYGEDEVAAARARSAGYYAELGLPAMAARYHHHTWAELQGFDVSLLHDPSAAMARLKRRFGVADSPFPWLRVRFPT
jgi:SAM-dependent methyltransferase